MHGSFGSERQTSTPSAENEAEGVGEVAAGRQPTPGEIDPAVRDAAGVAWDKLDSGALEFSIAEPSETSPATGPAGTQWHELGDPRRLPSQAPRTQPLFSGEPPLKGSADAAPSPFAATRLMPPPLAVTRRSSDSASSLPVAFDLAQGEWIGLRGTALALARTDQTAPHDFAGRLDAVQAIAGEVTTRVLYRRGRDAETTEVLGGVGSPMVRFAGEADVVFAAKPGHLLSLVRLDEDLAFAREDLLLGFEMRLSYENGRVPLDPVPTDSPRVGEAPLIVKLRGTGAFVLETPAALSGLPCSPGRPLLVRREWVAGWLGRLIARALSSAESPTGQRGLVSFGGQGVVMICGPSS